MHQTLHVERHFMASEVVRDIVIGMSDGLTVPFALAAGLSGTELVTTAIIVTAGLAEVAAGSIAMGLGGYLAARSDAEHYDSEKKRKRSRSWNCRTSNARRSPSSSATTVSARPRSSRSSRRSSATTPPGSIS